MGSLVKMCWPVLLWVTLTLMGCTETCQTAADDFDVVVNECCDKDLCGVEQTSCCLTLGWAIFKMNALDVCAGSPEVDEVRRNTQAEWLSQQKDELCVCTDVLTLLDTTVTDCCDQGKCAGDDDCCSTVQQSIDDLTKAETCESSGTRNDSQIKWEAQAAASYCNCNPLIDVLRKDADLSCANTTASITNCCSKLDQAIKDGEALEACAVDKKEALVLELNSTYLNTGCPAAGSGLSACASEVYSQDALVADCCSNQPSSVTCQSCCDTIDAANTTVDGICSGAEAGAGAQTGEQWRADIFEVWTSLENAGGCSFAPSMVLV